MITVSEKDINAELPPKWVLTSIGAICDINPRLNRPSDFDNDTLVSFIPMAAVDEITGTIANPEIRPVGEVWRGYTRFREGDVIFAKITPSMENGKAAIASNLMNGIGLGTTEFHVLSPTDLRIAKWIYHYIRQESFRGAAAHVMTGTAGQLRVPTDFLIEAVIPLAPYEEIGRIVDEIEAQFSRLDTWFEVMQKLREQLPRLRASILKAAVEGRLVEQDPNDEPAEVLLKRILDARRRKWEEDYLANLEAKGKPTPNDDKWKAKYKEPEAHQASGLSELPDGWVWTRLEELIYTIDAGKSFRAINRPAQSGEYGVLKVSAVSWGKFQSEENKALYSDYLPDPNHLVRYDDLIISRANTVELVGAVVLVREEYDNLMLSDKTLRLVPASDEVLKTYLVHAMRSHFVRDYYEPRATGTSDSMRNLAQSKILSAPIPLPPKEEQVRIVDDLERRFSVIERLEAIIEVNVKRAERMRQSVLKKAFEGRLVEPGPNDKSAGELLEHIQKERRRRAEEEKQKPTQQRERKVSIQTERKSLYETLKEAGKPLSARELFQQAGFTHATIDDFYEELREAVHELETIRRKRNKNNEVHLEVTG